ncbi:MAG: hypothetical protein WD533_08260 [Dehalococcoidia bacterium]
MRQERVLRLTLATGAVIAMGVATVAAGSLLDQWIGDFGALLWICACFFIPFITGIAWGSAGLGNRGRIAGALIGGGVALLPGALYTAAGGSLSGAEALNLPLLWAVFTPLGMAQGAIALPVGATARKRRPI